MTCPFPSLWKMICTFWLMQYRSQYREQITKVRVNYSGIFLVLCLLHLSGWSPHIKPIFQAFMLSHKKFGLLTHSHHIKTLCYPRVRSHIICFLRINSWTTRFFFLVSTSWGIILSINDRSLVPLQFRLHSFCNKSFSSR